MCPIRELSMGFITDYQLMASPLRGWHLLLCAVVSQKVIQELQHGRNEYLNFVRKLEIIWLAAVYFLVMWSCWERRKREYPKARNKQRPHWNKSNRGWNILKKHLEKSWFKIKEMKNCRSQWYLHFFSTWWKALCTKK